MYYDNTLPSFRLAKKKNPVGRPKKDKSVIGEIDTTTALFIISMVAIGCASMIVGSVL